MIKIQFSTNNYIGSVLIRKFTWSEYSHVDFLMDDGTLLGADFSGVAYRNNNPKRFTKTVVYEIPDAPIDVITVARQQIGKKYDYAGIFGLIGRHNWEQDDKWFCSELVAYCFNRCGHPLLNNDEKHWRITPRDLLLSPLLKKVI